MTCAKQTVRAEIHTISGYVITGTNYCLNPQKECPRKDMASGEGYELCIDICHQAGHAEVVACKRAGTLAKGGTLYLDGHSYICDDCMKVIEAAGIVKCIIGKP